MEYFLKCLRYFFPELKSKTKSNLPLSFELGILLNHFFLAGARLSEDHPGDPRRPAGGNQHTAKRTPRLVRVRRVIRSGVRGGGGSGVWGRRSEAPVGPEEGPHPRHRRVVAAVPPVDR